VDAREEKMQKLVLMVFSPVSIRDAIYF